MKISTKLSAVVLAALAAVSAVSCEKPVSEPEDNSNSFTYEGNTYKIRSVVLYELENNMTQIWMSETAGYTTIDEIEASVGELVITVPDSKIGQEKYSDDKELEGRFIKYDDKVNSGWMALSCSIDKANKNISIQFSSQTLKSAKNAIEGSYSGPYSEYTLAALENQWAYNRQAKAIKSVDYFEMEDGEPSRVVIYDDNIPALDIYLTPENIGVPVLLGTADKVPFGTEVYFDDGEEFKLSNSYGSILIKPTANDISISLKLTNEGGKTLAAEYEGAYRHRYGNKANRCIYDSGIDGGNGYDGKFSLISMKVSESADKITFRFTPGDHLGGGEIYATDPVLTVAKNLINAGEVNTQDISDALSFNYYTFQLDNEYTEAISGSVINIERDSNGIYTINAELAYVSSTVTKYRDMVDENGNLVYEWVLSDEFDEDGNQIKVERVVQEEYLEDVISTIDLFFKGPASKD